MLVRFRARRILTCLIAFITIFLLYSMTMDSSLMPDSSEVPLALPRKVYEPATSNHRRNNFVYIKMLKSASNTLSSIFRRYALQNNLSVVLPLTEPLKLYVGWPYVLRHGWFRPSRDRKYNALIEHSVYNREVMDKVMPPDTFYVTSLRQPFSQFKSLFHYYNIPKHAGIESANPLEEYLNNLEHYEKRYKMKQPDCVPTNFSLSRNIMSLTLGFPRGFPPGTPDQTGNMTYNRSWLARMGREMDLVLLTERMTESLVLLRRLLGWETHEILHLDQNVSGYSYKDTASRALEDIYRNHSRVDYLLYDYFNRTLSARLRAQPADFWEEVWYFRDLSLRVSRACGEGRQGLENGEVLRVAGTPWGRGFVVDAGRCDVMSQRPSRTYPLLDALQERYDREVKPWVPQPPKPDVFFC